MPLVLVAAIAGGVTLNRSAGDSAGGGDLHSGSPTDPAMFGVLVPAGPVRHFSTDVPGLTPGPVVDEAALAQVDPRQLYWAVLARQGTREVTDVVSSRWASTEDYVERFPRNVSVDHVGIDWGTRQFVDETFSVTEEDTVDMDYESTRCLGNEQRAVYFPPRPGLEMPGRWEVRSAEGEMLCGGRMKPRAVIGNSGSTDGIAPGGLTRKQMDAFLSYVDGVPGLIEVARPTTVRGDDGEQYIQLDVTLTPQDPRVGPGVDRLGAGFLAVAFAQTGIHPYDYGYSIDIGPQQGRRMRYFIDPQTLLPAYSVMHSTGVLRLDGSPVPNAEARVYDAYYVHQYSWPDALDPAASRAEGTPVYPYRPWPFEHVIFDE